MSQPRTNIVQLVQPKSEPDEAMVEMLTGVLEAAKAGKLAAVCLVWEYPEGGTGYRCCHAAGSKPMLLLGEVTRAQFRIAARFANEDETEE